MQNRVGVRVHFFEKNMFDIFRNLICISTPCVWPAATLAVTFDQIILTIYYLDCSLWGLGATVRLLTSSDQRWVVNLTCWSASIADHHLAITVEQRDNWYMIKWSHMIYDIVNNWYMSNCLVWCKLCFGRRCQRETTTSFSCPCDNGRSCCNALSSSVTLCATTAVLTTRSDQQVGFGLAMLSCVALSFQIFFFFGVVFSKLCMAKGYSYSQHIFLNRPRSYAPSFRTT